MVSKFTGPSARSLCLANQDVDQREREAVEAATAAREARIEAEGDEDTVWVSEEDLERVQNEGSVWVFTGSDAQGRVVRFGVDHRPAGGLIEAVRAEGILPCHVESWQVLSRTSAALV